MRACITLVTPPRVFATFSSTVQHATCSSWFSTYFSITSYTRSRHLWFRNTGTAFLEDVPEASTQNTGVRSASTS